jgi:hypothetical protein
MSMLELKVWQARCDGCGALGPVTFAQYNPGPPAEWGDRVAHDCGLTGYSSLRIYCVDCTERRTKQVCRQAVADREEARAERAKL